MITAEDIAEYRRETNRLLVEVGRPPPLTEAQIEQTQAQLEGVDANGMAETMRYLRLVRDSVLKRARLVAARGAIRGRA